MKTTSRLNRFPYPRALLVDIHSYCNARCIICPYSQLHKKNPMGFMTWGLYTKIVNEYSKMMAQYSFKGKLGYCQMGEPFILKDIAKWVQYATNRGIDVYFNTNASLLFPAVVDSLLDIGFSGNFNISFHGITKEIYERIMGLDFDKTIRNLKYLLRKYPRDKISVNTVPYDWPVGEKEKLLEYWSEMGISVTISKALSRSGLVPNIRRIRRKRIAGCRTKRVFYEMVISFNGDVLLCCHDMAREVVLGNLHDSTINEIWNGQRFLGIINKIYFDRDLPSDFICKRCEESEPYWSPRRMVKNLIPKKIMNEIRKRRKSRWIVTQSVKTGEK
jgi:radical SAM protein with 4Fe4S-binding SPASM domain